MNIRFNSAYTAPNNKPAFGDNAQCFKALQDFYKDNTTHTNELFRAYAQTLDDKPKFIEQAKKFIQDNNPKPYFIKVVKRTLGIEQ